MQKCLHTKLGTSTTIEKEAWGKTKDGQAVHRYLMTNKNGMELEVSDFGALILAIRIPRSNGEKVDVALGYDTVEEYYNIECGFGAYVGRNANRIGNGKVTIEDVEYQLDINNHCNNLHSGFVRSHCQFYEVKEGCTEHAVWLEFSRISPHMEQGFPGDLDQHIRYTLTADNEVYIDYDMQSDRTTVINPTNHCYFNLAGHNSGDILTHVMEIYADGFTITDKNLLPTGEIADVTNTPMDFRKAVVVGERIDADYEPLQFAGGYDHNYVFPNDGKQKKMAQITSPSGDITMSVYSDLCGLQVYSGNFLMDEKGKEGAVYRRRNGICFETQFYPNSCNEKAFPSCIFKAGERFVSRTVYEFKF